MVCAEDELALDDEEEDDVVAACCPPQPASVMTDATQSAPTVRSFYH